MESSGSSQLLALSIKQYCVISKKNINLDTQSNKNLKSCVSTHFFILKQIRGTLHKIFKSTIRKWYKI